MKLLKFLPTKLFSLVMASVVLLFAGSNGAQPHSAQRPDELLLNVAVMADVHIEGNNLSRLNAFCRILKDANNTSTPNDAVIFLGDNTMNGQHIESNLFYGCVRSVLGNTPVLVAPGNHDFSNGKEEYPPYAERFINYNNTFLGANLTMPYYYRVINGCFFIVLSSEDSLVHEMKISDRQFEWFCNVMELAGRSGKPIFVIAHHPYYSLSDDSPFDLAEVMAQYSNVFYLYGHTHIQLSEGWTFRDSDNIHIVNLPRVTELSGENDNQTDDNTGFGAQFEVYEDEVVFRARGFYCGEWADGFEQHWALV